MGPSITPDGKAAPHLLEYETSHRHDVANGADPDVLAAANIAGAKYLFLAIHEPFEVAEITRHSRTVNAALVIVARAHFEAEVEHLTEFCASAVIMGEREIARGMVDYVFDRKENAPPVG
jgi:CPA2 family monovalent cation:H+ antiporter-2